MTNYHILLKCGERFDFHAYRHLTVRNGRISLQVQLTPKSVFLPRGAKLSIKWRQIFGVTIAKHYLVIYKAMIESTNLDFTKKTSKSKRTPRKPNMRELIGDFYLDKGRAPCEEELAWLKRKHGL